MLHSTDASSPDLFDKDIDTLREIFVIESRKTRNKLLTAAIVIAGFDMIAFARADLLSMAYRMHEKPQE